MGLTKTGGSVKEQGIIIFRRAVANQKACLICNAVGGAYNKVIKGISRVDINLLLLILLFFYLLCLFLLFFRLSRLILLLGNKGKVNFLYFKLMLKTVYKRGKVFFLNNASLPIVTAKNGCSRIFLLRNQEHLGKYT